QSTNAARRERDRYHGIRPTLSSGVTRHRLTSARLTARLLKVNAMRSLPELVDAADPARPLVEQWIREARRPVEVLTTERHRREQALLTLQVTTRSPMGALAYQTGGLLIDHG